MYTTSLLRLLIVAIVSTSVISAQDAGDNFYKNDLLHTIELEFAQPDYWEQMESNFESNFGGSNHIYILGKVTIDGEILDSVGVRFKGFTSYPFEGDKKPFKLDFNEYVDGQRYDGLRKMNLNNGTGDPAFHRDVLCYKMMRDMGVKAPRTSWARVYVNGQYWGLYQTIEQVDKEFLKNNFADAEGNLFKNKGWSFLDWLGANQSEYASIFELKTNKDEDDWEGFIQLMNIINNTSDDDFRSMIESHFNVDLFLRTLAVDVATNNWDSFMEHGRNWYMYEDTDGVFHWIPWDYNFALGGTFGFGGSDDCFFFPFFYFFTNGTGEVDFQFAGFRTDGCLNTEYKWDFGDGNTSDLVSPTHIYDTPSIYEVCLTMTDDGQSMTECRTVDTTFDPALCTTIVNGTAGHPADIVFQEVIESNPNCCDFWSGNCENEWQDTNDFINGGNGNNFDIDQTNNERVLIRRLLNIAEYREQYESYFCTISDEVMTEERLFTIMDENRLLIEESVEEDPNNLFNYQRFLVDIGAIEETDGLKGYIKNRITTLSQDVDANITCLPRGEQLFYQEMVINEVVASNDSIGGQADPDGGYPDWIEFYNTTDRELDLSGVFLSDDRDDLRKWEFPLNTTIAVDDYLIVWADNDLMQQGLHAAFKLKKEGEGIYLSNGDGSLIDSVYYAEQQTNIGWARIPNGTGDFEFWTTTFDDNNENGISSTENPLASDNLNIFPNPTTGLVNIKSLSGRMEQILVQDASGKALQQETLMLNSYELDLSAREAGLYIIQIQLANGNTVQERIVKIVP